MYNDDNDDTCKSTVDLILSILLVEGCILEL